MERFTIFVENKVSIFQEMCIKGGNDGKSGQEKRSDFHSDSRWD